MVHILYSSDMGNSDSPSITHNVILLFPTYFEFCKCVFSGSVAHDWCEDPA